MVQNAGFVPKNRQNKRGEKLEIGVIYLLWDYIFARTERKLGRHCKIKDNNLSF